MNRVLSTASLVAVAVGLVGCSSGPQTMDSQTACGTTEVSLGAFGPVAQTRPFFFGAGDSVGADMFAVYVASLDLQPEQADTRFATGSNEGAFPD